MGIDKARSIAVLSEKLGITREEVAAMGDGYNDLSMIKYAGLGIAMNNAQEPVKAAADYIAPSNDEDGVAIAVERYFLHAFKTDSPIYKYLLYLCLSKRTNYQTLWNNN